ncbi:MAG: RNA ligase family protein [Dehalococcoidia bacterium]|nr:RNA ligase family protein [Dehalococcoidia bacterium]
MTEFFRFPRTPHLAWLGPGQPRDDKLLTPGEADDLLTHDVVVEEKVDGANVGLSLDENGVLRAQNRGSYLSPGHAHPQFVPLFRWLAAREHRLADALFPDLMLFGEWCYAVHSVTYTQLPSWFLLFDVFDRQEQRFWSTGRRDELAARLGLAIVPLLATGRFDLPGLRSLLAESRLKSGPPEGIYVRYETPHYLVARAKLVRPEFVQAIGTHWSHGELKTNTLASGRTYGYD